MSNDRLAWLKAALHDWDHRGLRRRTTRRDTPQGPVITLDGRELANFGSNDYLGLANDERLVRAARTALVSEGWGAGSSPLICGRAVGHDALERALAEFEGTEAALLFPSGFAANMGTIPAVVGPGDAIFSDALNHASLIDGCRLSRADIHIYPHRDTEYLEKLFSENPARRRMIVTDSLFSMEGDIAPLRDLADLAKRWEAMLMVDETHATGVFGSHGRGLCEELEVEADVDIRIGTLSKAFGCIGGFVCGKQTLIDWLFQKARPYVFSTAFPAMAAEVAVTALDIVRSEPRRRITLLDKVAKTREYWRNLGWDVGDSESQIIPLHIGDSARAMNLAEYLRNQGCFVPAIRPPSVPEGQALLRVSLSAAHTPDMLGRLTEALAAAPRQGL